MKNLFTRKIYHGKFDHRVTLKARHANGQNKDIPSADVVDWLLHKEFKSTEIKYRTLNTYSYINSTYTVSVYFKDAKVMEMLQKNIAADYFIEFEKPMDESHTALLESNDKLLTRKQLFFDKYRMVLRVKPQKKNSWSYDFTRIREIKAWCIEQFGSERANSDRYMMGGHSNGNFYFADTKDALLFKLTWGGEDVKTERVITHAELEERGFAKA